MSSFRVRSVNQSHSSNHIFEISDVFNTSQYL